MKHENSVLRTACNAGLLSFLLMILTGFNIKNIFKPDNNIPGELYEKTDNNAGDAHSNFLLFIFKS